MSTEGHRNSGKELPLLGTGLTVTLCAGLVSAAVLETISRCLEKSGAGTYAVTESLSGGALFLFLATGIYATCRVCGDRRVRNAIIIAILCVALSHFADMAADSETHAVFPALKAFHPFFGTLEHVSFIGGFAFLMISLYWALIAARQTRDRLAQEILCSERLHDACRTSEERYREILEGIDEGYYEVDLKGDFIFANGALCRTLGYSLDEILQLNYRANYADEAAIKRAQGAAEHVYKTREPMRAVDWEMVRKDGERRMFEMSMALILDDDDRPLGFRGIMRDVTERRERERALRKAEEANRALLNAMPDTMVLVRKDGTILDFRADVEESSSSRRVERFIGKKLWEVFPEERAHVAMDQAKQVLATGFVQSVEYQLHRGNMEHYYEARLVASGEDEVVAVIREITTRKQAEAALRESERRYRNLFENANDIVYTHDLRGHMTSLNEEGERVFGYSREEAVKHNVLDILVEEDRGRAEQMIRRKLAGEETGRYEVRVLAKNGQEVPVEISTSLVQIDGRPVGIQGIARDITERKRAEEDRKRLEAQVRHAQKLESLGLLAGGIAHDFNNLLVGILGNAGLTLSKLPETSPVRGYVTRIETSAQRAADLTHQMLAYSGRGTFVVRPLCLSKLAQEMGNLLQTAVSKKTLLQYSFPKTPLFVRGDSSQLQQVVMNLITNAADAIGDHPGVITVKTREVDIDRVYLSETYLNDDLAEGRYVCLEVSDTGCGMDAETKSRIFDPFFSTKFAGRGLGLAAALGIVRAHKGAINIYSEAGRGTTFKVFLPLMPQDEPANGEQACETQPGGDEEWHSSGLVLLADDDESARDVGRELLEELGFSVVTAENGKEAVDLFKAHASELVAVLLDLTMPVLNGGKAMEQMKEIRAGVPVILSSGYTEQDAVSDCSGSGPAAFLQKPYMPRELTAALRVALGEEPCLASPPEPET